MYDPTDPFGIGATVRQFKAKLDAREPRFQGQQPPLVFERRESVLASTPFRAIKEEELPLPPAVPDTTSLTVVLVFNDGAMPVTSATVTVTGTGSEPTGYGGSITYDDGGYITVSLNLAESGGWEISWVYISEYFDDGDLMTQNTPSTSPLGDYTGSNYQGNYNPDGSPAAGTATVSS